MKYSATVLLALAAGILVLAWTLAGRGIGPGLPRSGSAELAELSRRITVAPQELNALREARRKAVALQSMQPAGLLADLPVLIDTRPVTAATAAVDPEEKEGAEALKDVPQREYLLSMVFVGPDKKYAVIDGLFRQEGDRVPGGAEVLAIREGLVELRERRGTRRVLRLREGRRGGHAGQMNR